MNKDINEIEDKDDDNKDLDIFIEKDNSLISFSDIVPFDVLLVSESEGVGCNVIRMLVCSQKTTSELNGISENEIVVGKEISIVVGIKRG